MSRLSPELRAMLLYEDAPYYAFWLKFILLGSLGLTFILGFYLLAVDLAGALTCFGVTIFDAILFSLIFPRRYQLFADRVRIVLGGPFAFTIPLNKIRGVRVLSGKGIFKGRSVSVNFVTNINNVLEITRHGGWAVTISPSHPEAFAEHLNRALKS
ncbi:MAG: hypothetical protein PHR43_07775 [Dehalococcoidales bacterium]|nr:hypothetical protein [Dehalococcoidales bacterium]